MIIRKLSEYEGAEKFGNCIECGKCESEYHNLYRLKFNGEGVITLCPDCFIQARIKMNSIVIDNDSG